MFCARMGIDEGYVDVTPSTSAEALALLKSTMPVVFHGRKVTKSGQISGSASNQAVWSTCH